ncbi:hypothetical protein [Pseudomonas sp. CGJS7]|uniref:hypothetical protein n=1 Tax=Pseudomonas sp. CGJS7 TaxID=3109348 RepID=UPI003009E8D3
MSKLLNFPAGPAGRLEGAIRLFDGGDRSLALYLEFKEIAQQGVAEAWFYLACMYEDGSNGQLRDLEKALHCYENAINEIGLVEAMLGAARIYYSRGQAGRRAECLSNGIRLLPKGRRW